jgi:Domain of unknown function (DUF4352)
VQRTPEFLPAVGRMARTSKRIAATVVIVVVIGILLVAMLAILNRRNEVVGLNQEIQYDDFAFSVQGVRKASTLGKGDSQTLNGVYFYVVTIKVTNHAKRVDYTFKRSSAVLVDDAGREFHLSDNGQRALESAQSNRCADPIPAGASCITEVVFEVAEDAGPLQLRFSEGGSIGDILDFVFYGTKRIGLGLLK